MTRLVRLTAVLLMGFLASPLAQAQDADRVTVTAS